MRAAHTLTSSSRTTGFESIGDVAYALEKWLQDAMGHPLHFDDRRRSVTRNAVDALTAMAQSIRGNALPYPREDIIAELGALREGLRRELEAPPADLSPEPVAEVPLSFEPVVVPEPAAEIEPVVTPEPEPVAEIEPIVTPAPEPVAEIEPVVMPEPVAEIEPVVTPEPVAEIV